MAVYPLLFDLIHFLPVRPVLLDGSWYHDSIWLAGGQGTTTIVYGRGVKMTMYSGDEVLGSWYHLVFGHDTKKHGVLRTWVSLSVMVMRY
jgi:hypothetical protein